METMYEWRIIDPLELKEIVKKEQNRIYCKRCENLLLSISGSVLTRENIWEYSSNSIVYGYTHESCAYAIEVVGIEANTKDPNYGRPPNEWK